MAKEIHEQPEVVARTLAHYIDFASGAVRLPFELPVDAATLTGITITACGTAYYAGHGRQILVRAVRPPAASKSTSPRSSAIASRLLEQGGLMIVVSQSGETADTLASLRYAKAQGQKIIARGQCADLDHRARERRRRADPGRAGNRRRLDQGLHLPAGRAGLLWRSPSAGRAACSTPRRKKRSWSTN